MSNSRGNNDSDTETTCVGTSISEATSSPDVAVKDDDLTTAEEQLFDIAVRSHVPLTRMEGESLHGVAERLTLDIERRIALLLLYLEDIDNLDLDDNEAVPS